MNAKTLLAGTTIALALTAAAAPASATQFAAIATSGSSIFDYTSVGSNPASLFTIGSPTGTSAGPVTVLFSFQNEGLLSDAVTDVSATFSFSATSDSPVAVQSTAPHDLVQDTAGSFSIISKSAITVNGRTYAAGSNLLSGAYTEGYIVGKNHQADIAADNDGIDTLTYTSAFLSFPANAEYGSTFTFGDVLPALAVKVGSTNFKNFKTTGSADFSSTPLPSVNAVPEPASWALMMAGFGLAGVSMRRRVRVQSAA